MNKLLFHNPIIKIVAISLLVSIIPQSLRGQTVQESKEYYLYVGTYASGRSEGINICRFDATSGDLTLLDVVVGVANPSFLAIDFTYRFLYAVTEVSRFDGQAGGAVSAFSIDAKTGGLTFLNQTFSHGASPCYVSVDRQGKWVLAANYSSGNCCVLPVQEDGRLGDATDIVQHSGSGADPRRQSGPHAHSILFDAANRFVFAPDLGIDKIMIYRFDATAGKLLPNDPPFAQVKPGAGPRHFDFHPSGKYAFSIHELDSTMASYAYDEAKGSLQEIQIVTTLPEGFTGDNTCADVHVSPNGKFLYGSNRGHDSIVIYAIDENDGKLTYVGHESTRGSTPRNFNIDPTGNFLLAANQNSNSIVVFHIDAQTGKLEFTGNSIEVSRPVCLKFMPISKGAANATTF